MSAIVRGVARHPESLMDAPSNVKAAARQLVERLPEGASWDDLMYEIYVRQAIDEGLADVAAGRTVSAAEVRAELGLPPR
jgi:predicted transcriptional regulator